MLPTDRKIIRNIIDKMQDTYYTDGIDGQEVLDEIILACVAIAHTENDFGILDRVANYA